MKNNKFIQMIIAVGIAVILLSGTLVYIFIFQNGEDEDIIIEPTIPLTHYSTMTYDQMEQEGILDQIEIVDDRISPYSNQGLVLEVLRIRHRGFLEKFLTRGNSWKDVPEFYYISYIDGMEFKSKDLKQHQQTREILINTWDSMFQESKVMRTAVQGQEKSHITLTIVEREKAGLLGIQSVDSQKDSFSLTYCYRTGRWTGDDSFRDSDGYGYYLGDTFEVWFNLYQPDYDDDYIPYWTEVNILGTDPTMDDVNYDPDDDGTPIYWEWKWGYDPFTWDGHEHLDPDLDSIYNIKEYQFEKWFADPFSENLYIEVDHMERGGILDPPHIFYDECVQGITERFAQHNIKAFIDNGWHNSPPKGGGEEVEHIDMLSMDSGMMLQFYNNNFPDDRKGSFIYTLVGHDRAGGFQHPAKGNVYDIIHIAYTPFTFKPIDLLTGIGYGIIPTPRGIRVALAAVFLHEIGHFGGFIPELFEGVDNLDGNLLGKLNDRFFSAEFAETWGNYKSVMNYGVMYRPNLLDYSSGENGPPYDQDDWANFHLGGWSRTSLSIEEANYYAYDEETRDKLIDTDYDDIEIPPITGYVFDQNLTDEFEKQVGYWSPNVRWNVEWEVHRLIDDEEHTNNRDVKVLVSPKDIVSKYESYWSLFMEGDFDNDGNILFTNTIPIEKLELNNSD